MIMNPVVSLSAQPSTIPQNSSRRGTASGAQPLASAATSTADAIQAASSAEEVSADPANKTHPRTKVEQLAGEHEQVASDRRKNATEAEKGKEGESEPPLLLGVAYTLASPSDPLDLGAPIITALERNCEAFTVAQELGQVSRRPDCLCKATNAMTERLQFVTNRRPWFCSCSSPRWFLPEVVVASAWTDWSCLG